MSIEARFTIRGKDTEIPFTIIERDNDNFFLFSIYNNVEYIFPLIEENGLLRLNDYSPFEEDIEIVNERLTGLSSDWIESKSQGFENTDLKYENDNQKPGYSPDDIYVENKPFSLRQIFELISDGDIELFPDFQRNFVWDRTRQSKLIESILLGLPLPSIYLSQYEDGRLTVVDGLQRLTTIKKFIENNLVLNNLEYLVDCNNKRYSDLEKVLSPLRLRKFSQTQIMCFVIDYRSPNQLKFDLFRRLNTGGKPLNNPEIRNCLSRPHLQSVLYRMINTDGFLLATDRSIKDNRMEGRDAALRFIYFYEQFTNTNPIGTYSGDIEKTLDEFVDDLNNRRPEQLEVYVDIYNQSMHLAYKLFGFYCFRKVLPENLFGRRTAVNKLLMLSISVILAKNKLNYDPERINSSEFYLNELAFSIYEDEDLFRAITWGTNNKWNIEKSFLFFNDFFNQYIN